MNDLGSLLASVMEQKNWQCRLRLHQVFLFWDEVVGGEIGRHAKPRVIKGDVLWLAVSDPIWMQQLQFERRHLLELLNARLAEGDGARGGRLAELKFELDPSLGRSGPARPARASGQAIDQERFSRFATSLSSLPDEGLRESMKRLWLVMHSGGRGRP